MGTINGWQNTMTSELEEKVAQQFRMTFALGSCDPSNCLLCDCNMDDEGRAQIAGIAMQQAKAVIEWVYDAERASRAEAIALRQILEQFTNQGNLDRLISLAVEANDLMYANGQRDERARIRTEVLAYFKVAPAAAEPLLRIIDNKEA